MDRRAERMVEMMKALQPFAEESEHWEDFPDAQPLVEMWADGPSKSNITVGHLRAALAAIID